MKKKKILIIDDEIQLVDLVKMRLEANNYDVITAYQGTEGLEAARKELPNLILLDVLMPNMDGYQALRKLKEEELTKSIPVIMLTAKGDNISKMKSLQLYSEDFVTKPVGAQYIKSKIEEVLKRKVPE